MLKTVQVFPRRLLRRLLQVEARQSFPYEDLRALQQFHALRAACPAGLAGVQGVPEENEISQPQVVTSFVAFFLRRFQLVLDLVFFFTQPGQQRVAFLLGQLPRLY